MRKSRFTAEQIIGFLKEVEAAMICPSVYRFFTSNLLAHGIGLQTTTLFNFGGTSMAIRFALLCLLGVVLLGCGSKTRIAPIKEVETSATIETRNALIGRWLGEARTTDDGYRRWIVDRKSDGTYRIDFKSRSASGQVSVQSEVGLWGTSAGIYFTATRAFVEGSNVYSADTTDPALYDVYRIIELTPEWFEYESLSTKNRFKVRRIEEGESFPL